MAWGWCGDDCPVGEEYIRAHHTYTPWCEGDPCPEIDNGTIWGTDLTLRVTTHFVFNPQYIYIPMAVLGVLAFSLIIIAAILKCLGILK